MSDRELPRAAARAALHAPASQLAWSGAVRIAPDEPLKQAAELISDRRIRHLIASTSADHPAPTISTIELTGALA